VVIAKALSADHDVAVAETNRRGHATRLAQHAAGEGADAVVVLGGDGTLNEAANGLFGSETALGVLPGGSTNVFARTLGVVDDPVEATGQLVAALAAGSRDRIGVGTVNGRCFLFHVGMGFDAAVVNQVERRASLKRYASHPLFVYAAVLTWARHYDRTRPHFSVHHADGRVIDDGYLGICLNSNPYTYLGHRPFDLAPDATLDGLMAMVTVRTLALLPFLGIAASALLSGSRLRRHRRVDYRSDVQEVTIRGHGAFPYQVDGDYLGEVDSLHIRHVPDALTIVRP
jgi:diacylglycerol kinase family enzyme